jgi:hypothetical protein
MKGRKGEGRWGVGEWGSRGASLMRLNELKNTKMLAKKKGYVSLNLLSSPLPSLPTSPPPLLPLLKYEGG